ncbi:MAG: hypothetical protein BGN87_13255 [Rhizobiales bacterium 65-79]|nr:hypothetical protein [Hyphomicrobiales bacterium]OJU06225.1 MAG: hypothetical protein BGN87_13255 [Rhizobiales bacterium 65-79]
MPLSDGNPMRPTSPAERFLADPFGDHDANIQHLLLRLRSASAVGKHVLVEVEPFRRWRLAQLGDRGERPQLLDVYFDDLAEAERHVFHLRTERSASGDEA